MADGMSDSMHTVLIVDDEPRLRALVRQYLEREGYRVVVAETGPAALDQARAAQPDVVVLDIMLPGLDGLEVCHRLRAFSDAYVIMLTARAEEIDRVVGLEVGADDYLTKPFSPRELVARIRAMLRRSRRTNAFALPEVLAPQRFGTLVIDHGRREVTRAGATVPLTPLEFRLLAALAAYPGMVFTRAQLLEQVWGSHYFGDDHVVDVHVANLRKKLLVADTAPLIETVRGAGYRLRGQP